MKLQRIQYQHFKLAALFSIILAVLVAIFIAIYGKNDSFLIINKYNSPYLDYVFQYLTYLGDGIIWIPIFIYTILFKKEFLIAIIASLIICTILTHFLKRIVFPDELRPIGVLMDKVRVIPRFEVHRMHSFPSGHTSTAFTLALLFAYLAHKNFWTFFFPFMAFFVGYSRVYLAQHFVTDVFAGMLVGIVSAYLSLLIYNHFRNRKNEDREELEGEMLLDKGK
jgi:membrane-associated phospholipid phosphatase